jgi:hypothetical protein
MSAKISVIIKQPGRVPYKTAISPTLKNLQQTVDGYIETVTIAEDCVIICNEEGRLRELPYNCNIAGIDFVGTIVFAGVSGDDFADMPLDFQSFKAMFRGLWEDNNG